MDMDKLLKALEDDSNDNLLNFTTKKIHEMNLEILKELHLSREETLNLFNKLKNYKYVDEISDIKSGAFLRWIPIENPENIYLSNGAFCCDIKITNEGIYCVCKSVGYNAKHFLIAIDKNLIFQKLTDQELVLLSALDHLSK